MMHHRLLAEAALESPARAPWRRGADGGGAARRAVVADTPGALSDSGYDLEDSFLDEDGACALCYLSKPHTHGYIDLLI